MCSNVKFRLSPTSTLLVRGILVSVLLTLPVLAYVSPRSYVDRGPLG